MSLISQSHPNQATFRVHYLTRAVRDKPQNQRSNLPDVMETINNCYYKMEIIIK